MLVTAKPEDVGLSSERLDRIGPWMDSYIGAGKLPGGLALVARHGQVVYCQCRGQRDIEAGLPVEEDTIFRFYSMTKPITSTAIMMLYEEGHFQLDYPIARYLPEFADMQVYVSGEGSAMQTEPARDQITFRHLLTHTGGLTYGFFSRRRRLMRPTARMKSNSMVAVAARAIWPPTPAAWRINPC